MPCDWTHHLKQEWTLDQFQSEVDVDEIAAEMEQLIAEAATTVAHSERIRSSKQGTAVTLSSEGSPRRSKTR